MSAKNPDLYIMAKKATESMAVGLWNIYPDEIFTPVVELDKNIKFINADGTVAENKVFFNSNIPAYGFAGFEVEKQKQDSSKR